MNILITHVFGYHNKGDDALLKSLLLCVNEAFPSSNITGVCRDPKSQSKMFPEVNWIKQMGSSFRIGWRRRFENIYGLLSGWILFNNEFKDAVNCADVIIACPGGYLTDSNKCIVTNIIHLWIAVYSGAPVIMAPQSIGPFNNILWKSIISYVLGKVAMVCVREDESYHTVAKTLKIPEKSIVKCFDMALYEGNCNYTAGRNIINMLGLKEEFVAFTLIDWDYPLSPISQRHVLKDNYNLAILQTITCIYNKYKKKSLLLKQVESESIFSKEDQYLQNIEKMSKGLAIYCHGDYPPDIMKGIISHASIFIGTRMHSNIFALQSGVPCVAIAYLPKTIGIMRSLGLDDCVIEIEQISSNNLMEKINMVMEHHEYYTYKAKKSLDIAKKDRENFINNLKYIKPNNF